MLKNKPDIYLSIDEEDSDLKSQSTNEEGKKSNHYKVKNITVVNTNGGIFNTFSINPDDLYILLQGLELIEIAKNKRGH